MKKQTIYTLIFCLISIFNVSKVIGQEINLTYKKVDSIRHSEDFGIISKRNIAHNLQLIYNFNKIKNLLNHRDTIKVFKSDSTYIAEYKSKKIDLTARTIKKDSIIIIWGLQGKKDTISFLYAKYKTNLYNSQEIIVSRSKYQTNKQSISVTNYTNGIKNGMYEEISLSGELIAKGYYMLKDSIYIDTISTFDYETYEEIIELKPRSYTSEKCGSWIIINENGEIQTKHMKNDCK